MTAPDWPRTAGQLLAHIEACGAADGWTIDSDPSHPNDQCGRLRRTFRLVALADAEHAVVAEFGNLFVVLDGGRFDCLLRDLWRPLPLSETIREKGWCTSGALAFAQTLEHLFPHELFANAPPATP